MFSFQHIMVRNSIVTVTVILLATHAVLAHPPKGSRTKLQATNVLAKCDAPSPYPGDQGSPCTNEPLYYNFDYSLPADASRVDALHTTFCSEIGQLFVRGELQIDATEKTILGRYFDINDGEMPVLVSQVFQIMWDVTNGAAGSALPLVNTFIYDNNDYNGWCPETNSGNPSGDDSESSPEDGPEEGGYTDIDTNDTYEKIHFCEAAYNWPSLLDIQCTDLSDHPDVKMECLARIMFHEFTHYSTVGGPAGVAQIIDKNNTDELQAYYPARCHGLIDPNQDNNGVAAENNADSYAWMAANAFFSYTCETVNPPPPNNGNFNDPPNYVPGDPGDPPSG